MFSPNPKNDPLLAAIKGVIAENDKHREAVDRANKHFKITDKRQLPHNLHADYDKMLSESTIISEKITKSTPMGDVIRDFEKSDAPQFEGKSKEKRRQMAIAAKMAMNEALKGNQHKIDANKNNRIDAQDFEMLRNKNMSAEDVMKEAISNIAEKDSLSEAEKNILMELDVTDTEVMNSDLYKNAIKAVKDPRRIQIGQEVEGLGKFKQGDTIFSKVRSALAAQKMAPVVSRNDVPTTSSKSASGQIVPNRSLTPAQIGQEADNARLSGYRDIQQSGPSSGPAMQPRPADRIPSSQPINNFGDDPLRSQPGSYEVNADGTSVPTNMRVGGQVVRSDLAKNVPTQVRNPPLGGSPADKFTSLIRGTFGEETQYNVRKGDTLSAIAKRNNTTVDAIAKASGISDPNKLSIGQKIVIPGKMVAPVPLPRPDSRRPVQQEPAAVTMRPSATSTSGIGANVNTGVRQPMASMRPSATSTSGISAEVRPSVQDPRQKQMDAVLNNTSFSGNNTSLDNPLAGALASRYSDAKPTIDPSDKADQDQELADRLAQADMEASNQPKTTVDQYVKSLPSPELKTSVGLENWLNKMRR